MKEIKLTQGKVALVDDGDYEYLNQWRWHAKKGLHTYYAATQRCVDGKNITVRMHRLITNCPVGKMIDHINHDGLDNRRINLRMCSNRENQRNQIPRGFSSYLGVCFTKSGRKNWVAAIRINGKKVTLGYFYDEMDAALAYDKAAKKYHGEFANLNFKPSETSL